MSATKRPSTSSLRRFISSRPYVPIAELRRRFVLDEPDAMSRLARDGTTTYIGLPEREAVKIEALWVNYEIGLDMSVEVRAPVVVGVYPMRVVQYANGNGNGAAGGTGGTGAAGPSAPPALPEQPDEDAAD